MLVHSGTFSGISVFSFTTACMTCWIICFKILLVYYDSVSKFYLQRLKHFINVTKGLSQWMRNLCIKYRNYIEYWTTILWRRLMIIQSKAEVLTDLQTSQMTFSSYSMPSPSSVFTMVCTFSQQRISNSSITRSSWSSVTGCRPVTFRMACVAA